jgi:hypothetical protein
MGNEAGKGISSAKTVLCKKNTSLGNKVQRGWEVSSLWFLGAALAIYVKPKAVTAV